jgi:hypothetical protein
MFSLLNTRIGVHPSECNDSWYQSFYTKKKKGKNKDWNAKQVVPIDKDKAARK